MTRVFAAHVSSGRLVRPVTMLRAMRERFTIAAPSSRIFMVCPTQGEGPSGLVVTVPSEGAQLGRWPKIARCVRVWGHHLSVAQVSLYVMAV
jgi:hypothetical protein